MEFGEISPTADCLDFAGRSGHQKLEAGFLEPLIDQYTLMLGFEGINLNPEAQRRGADGNIASEQIGLGSYRFSPHEDSPQPTCPQWFLYGNAPKAYQYNSPNRITSGREEGGH